MYKGVNGWVVVEVGGWRCVLKKSLEVGKVEEGDKKWN